MSQTEYKSRKKSYILDTSVLLHRADALFSFQDNNVILPVVVLDEVDKFKRGSTELNRTARMVIKQLDTLRKQGSLVNGVDLENGGRLYIRLTNAKDFDLLPTGFDLKNDNRILAAALAEAQACKNNSDSEKQNCKIVLVSKDINMRVKADALGLCAEDYEFDKISDLDELYKGHREAFIPDELIKEIYGVKTISIDKLPVFEPPLSPNEFITIKGESTPSSTVLVKVSYDCKSLSLLRDVPDVWGIRPLNREQRFAFEALLDDNIQLVSLAGKAGTGKTILAIAVGLQRVVQDNYFRRLSIYRPVVPMGRDIGFLPGDEQEKLTPWMQPIMDNLEYLLDGQGSKKASYTSIDNLLNENILDIRALTYIRGRSLPQQFIIVDEAQNLTPHEVKTIVTRAGEGTKIVFTGDPYQIDNPYLDSTSNGLTQLVESFKGQSIAAHVTLTKGERSKLAEVASIVME